MHYEKDEQVEYFGVLYIISREVTKEYGKREIIKKYKGVAKGPLYPRGDSNYNACFIANDPCTIKRTYLKFLFLNDPDSCVPYSDNFFLLEEDDDLARKAFMDAANTQAYVLFERLENIKCQYEAAIDKVNAIEKMEIVNV